MFPTERTLSAGLPATLAGDSHPALLMLGGWSIWSPRPLSFLGSPPRSFWVPMSLSLPSSFHSQHHPAGMVCFEAPERWKLWLRPQAWFTADPPCRLCRDNAVGRQGGLVAEAWAWPACVSSWPSAHRPCSSSTHRVTATCCLASVAVGMLASRSRDGPFAAGTMGVFGLLGTVLFSPAASSLPGLLLL